MTIPQKDNPLGLPEVIEDAEMATRAVAVSMTLIDEDEKLREAVNKTQIGNPISVKVVPSGSEMTEKLLRRASAAGEDWLRGYENPSADFKQAGIAAAGKHKQRTQEALNEGRYAKAMAKVDVELALDTARRVGGAGYTAGITAREGKIRAVFDDLSPRLAAVKRTIAQMPQDTEAQREQRLIAARKAMIEIGRARRGG